jgi:hypothetical protein
MRKPNIIQVKVSGYVYNVSYETRKNKATINKQQTTNMPGLMNLLHQYLIKNYQGVLQTSLDFLFQLYYTIFFNFLYSVGLLLIILLLLLAYELKIYKEPVPKNWGSFYDEGLAPNIAKNEKKGKPGEFHDKRPVRRYREEDEPNWNVLNFTVIILIILHEIYLLLLATFFHLLMLYFLDLHIAFITLVQHGRFITIFVCFFGVILSYFFEPAMGRMQSILLALYCIVPTSILYLYTGEFLQAATRLFY